MKAKDNAKVIAISGASGSGKTSIVKALSTFYSYPYLMFDDFVDDQTYPKDMKHWLADGADVSKINTPRFRDTLQDRIRTRDGGLLFIEEPFGRNRDSLSPLIDYVILLDVPLEVCLSRVISRTIKQSSRDTVKSISNYLAMYDSHMGEIYRHTVAQTRRCADLIIEKTGPIEESIDEISSWIEKTVIE